VLAEHRQVDARVLVSGEADEADLAFLLGLEGLGSAPFSMTQSGSLS